MKIKKLISVILIAITVLCFCGCDEIIDEFTPTTQSTTQSTTQATTQAPTQSTTQATTQAPTLAPTDGTTLTVHYLDVGQGDSIFIELPQNKTMLIDASTGAYGEGIADYIEQKGYSKIDYLVATHPHADHIGGMEDIVKEFTIGEIYMPRASTTTKTYKNLLTAIKAKGNKINTAEAGVSIYGDSSLRIDILAPNSTSYEDLNNYSAVIKLSYGSRSFLFTGDAEKLSENEITADVSADVLKVGHHGSSTSSGEAFISRVNPKYAVISCGKDNSYGHPHKETMETLQKHNTEVFRTDTMGTIIATTNGTDLNLTQGNKSVAKDD